MLLILEFSWKNKSERKETFLSSVRYLKRRTSVAFQNSSFISHDGAAVPYSIGRTVFFSPLGLSPPRLIRRSIREESRRLQRCSSKFALLAVRLFLWTSNFDFLLTSSLHIRSPCCTTVSRIFTNFRQHFLKNV